MSQVCWQCALSQIPCIRDIELTRPRSPATSKTSATAARHKQENARQTLNSTLTYRPAVFCRDSPLHTDDVFLVMKRAELNKNPQSHKNMYEW